MSAEHSLLSSKSLARFRSSSPRSEILEKLIPSRRQRSICDANFDASKLDTSSSSFTRECAFATSITPMPTRQSNPSYNWPSRRYAAQLDRFKEWRCAAFNRRGRPVAGDTRQACGDSRRELALIEEVLQSGTPWWGPRDLGLARCPR